MVTAYGLAKLRSFEGLRLEAYPDPASGGDPWTIGYGHTRGVHAGDTCTAAQAEAWLDEDAAQAEAAVGRLVHVPLDPGQVDALVSFVFNLGASALSTSTLLRKLNAGDYAGAAAEFGRWNHAGGQVMPGLTSRRAEEAAMFTGGAPVQAPAQAPTEAHMPIPALIPPLIKALLPTLIDAIPKLGKLFSDGGRVSERNLAAATTVMEIVQQATSTPNAQAAVEAVVADPVVRQAAADAIEARWYELAEAGGGGIEGARKANAALAESGVNALLTPAFIISLVMIVMPMMMLVDMFFVHPSAYAGEMRTQVITGVLMVIGVVGGYWLGSSFGSARKNDLLAGK